jgi:hypothetical protein
MIRHLIAGLLAALSVNAVAHDLVTAESVQAYLSRVGELQKTLTAGRDGETRAKASLRLGQTLDEIRELFNGDIEAHGKVQGLASSVLMSELTANGTPLAYSVRANRFTANLIYYRNALLWDPSGPAASEASFCLLHGYFYDSIGADPLQPVAQDRSQLAEQIKLGEKLRRDFPRHMQREEISFILAIYYMQAARAAAEAGTRTRFTATARERVSEFARAYPDSLRTPTLTALLESVSAAK